LSYAKVITSQDGEDGGVTWNMAAGRLSGIGKRSQISRSTRKALFPTTATSSQLCDRWREKAFRPLPHRTTAARRLTIATASVDPSGGIDVEWIEIEVRHEARLLRGVRQDLELAAAPLPAESAMLFMLTWPVPIVATVASRRS
jgi:hypothetical protein